MQRRQRAIALAALALALVGLALLGGRKRGDVEAARVFESPAPRGFVAMPAPPPSAPTPSVSPARARFGEALAQYRRDAVYPPWSRPLDAGALYKLAWNEAIVSDLPFASGGLRYHFAADRHHVTFGEALTSWIEVWQADGRRVPLAVSNAWVVVTSGDAQGRAVELRYHDDGRDGDAVAGDLRYTNRFVPAEHDELRQSRQVQLRAEVSAAGVVRPVLRDFTYAARPVLEVKGVSDVVKDGSLVVTLACEVFEAGLYTFEANVTSVDEVPIAYVDQSFRLEPGRRRVELTFFGRTFRDRGLDGPYVVRDIRGFRRFLDGEEANVWFSYAGSHVTQAHAVQAFSDAEWQAPEKDDHLRRLEAALAATP